MSKSTFPQALQSFYKSNGFDAGFATDGPSLTRQEFAEECDINSLMSKYEGHVIGGPGNMAPVQPMYFDFTEHPKTLMDFMQLQQTAAEAFNSLPAVVRKEFENDAMMFVEFASDPENLSQMRTWGLAPPAPVEPPPAAPASPAGGSAPPVNNAPGAAGGASTHGPT